jgi:hypothetical protein
MYLDALKVAYQAAGYTPPTGCTEKEMDTLAQTFGLPLPAAYREFLAWAGHEAGNLFPSDDEYRYDELVELQTGARAMVQASGYTGALPDDMVIIHLYFGIQFVFFSASEGDDPPVYLFTWIPPSMEVTVQTREGIEHHRTLALPERPPSIRTHYKLSDWLLQYLQV